MTGGLFNALEHERRHNNELCNNTVILEGLEECMEKKQCDEKLKSKILFMSGIHFRKCLIEMYYGYLSSCKGPWQKVRALFIKKFGRKIMYYLYIPLPITS